MSSDNLITFASSIRDGVPTKIEKASSPLAMVNLAGSTCIASKRTKLGYDILEYERGPNTFYLVLDRMTGAWAYVTFPPES